MTARRSLTQLQRAALFEAHGGRCHICGQKISGKGWDVEHVIPLAMGGEDGGSNLRPAHDACHGEKTAADLNDLAKVKRVRAKHLGAKKPTTFPKLPAGYRYDWKRGRPVKVSA